jgi:hypothetical protein
MKLNKAKKVLRVRVIATRQSHRLGGLYAFSLWSLNIPEWIPSAQRPLKTTDARRRTEDQLSLILDEVVLDREDICTQVLPAPMISTE